MRARRAPCLALALAASLALGLALPALAKADCASPAAKALRADARRATQWNWGWGGLFAVSIAAHSGLALLTDDSDQRVVLWTGAAKSTIATLNQLIRPIRIYAPKAPCEALGAQLLQATEVERKKRNWFAHASVVAVNGVAFAYVQYRTGDVRLSLTGAVLGSLVGELAIFTTPQRVREGGFAFDSVHLVPSVSDDSLGLLLGGQF